MSSSMVRHDPPAAVILSFAPAEKPSAATVNEWLISLLQDFSGYKYKVFIQGVPVKPAQVDFNVLPRWAGKSVRNVTPERCFTLAGLLLKT